MRKGARRLTVESSPVECSMIRPKGLLLTAWIMVVLNVTGWILQYWPRRVHRVHLHAFTVIVFALLLLMIRIGAFVCIYCYVQGRNGARIAVLLTSVLAILNLFRLRHEAAAYAISGAAWGILGVFFLYWLNTRPIREYFTQGAASDADGGQS